MDKCARKSRDIEFFSEKNQRIICVHSQSARQYARYLEEQDWVTKYETCIPLDQARYGNINPVDIRQAYFQESWATDFLLHYADGHCGVRELADAAELSRRAKIEQLEFSRRYWSVMDVAEWKVVLEEAHG